jgi:hypothetical protein
MSSRMPLSPILRSTADEGVFHIEDPKIKHLYTVAWSIRNLADGLISDKSLDEIHRSLTQLYADLLEKIQEEEDNIRESERTSPVPTSVPNLFGKPKSQ